MFVGGSHTWHTQVASDWKLRVNRSQPAGHPLSSKCWIFQYFFRRGTFQFGRGRSTLIVKEGNRFLFSMKGTFSVKEDLRYLSNWRGGGRHLYGDGCLSIGGRVKFFSSIVELGRKSFCLERTISHICHFSSRAKSLANHFYTLILIVKLSLCCSFGLVNH